MVAPDNYPEKGLGKYLPLLFLLAACVIIIVLPLRKEIWYDETVSILCSKGISHDSPNLFSNSAAINSNDIKLQNTAGNVFAATVVDNGNSFLYNIGLHWFTLLFGNSIAVYMLFSKFWAIASLVAFMALCRLFLRNNLFLTLAIILFATDAGFIAMSHEIRAYSMGIFFVTMAAIYFYKFLFVNEKPMHLFLLALFSVAALLTHYLSVYIILVFFIVLVVRKNKAILFPQNLLAVALPVCLLVIYFYISWSGVKTMNIQSNSIQDKFANIHFSIGNAVFSSMKIFALNFKVYFPVFLDNRILFFVSFAFVLALYFAGIKSARDKEQKTNLHLLFLCGAFGSLFLLALSIKSQHYVSLSFRYNSFCLPLTSLFIAYVVYLIFSNAKVNMVIKGGLLATIVVPVGAYLVLHTLHEDATVWYNHVAVSNEIVKENVTAVDLPRWRDAFLIQAVLPGSYKIDYFCQPSAADFTLHKSSGDVKIPVIRQDK